MPYPIIVASFLKVDGLTLFPFILIRTSDMRNDKALIRHEMIHIKQQLELLVILFYVLYLLNYLFNRLKYRGHYPAYKNIAFEREAYWHDAELDYLEKRKFWAWIGYFKTVDMPKF